MNAQTQTSNKSAVTIAITADKPNSDIFDINEHL